MHGNSNIKFYGVPLRRSTAFTGMGRQIFLNSARHLKILGDRRGKWSKFRTQNLQILPTTVQNSVVTTAWAPGFVHPWYQARWNLFLRGAHQKEYKGH